MITDGICNNSSCCELPYPHHKHYYADSHNQLFPRSAWSMAHYSELLAFQSKTVKPKTNQVSITSDMNFVVIEGAAVKMKIVELWSYAR